jgi:hypothetical protein
MSVRGLMSTPGSIAQSLEVSSVLCGKQLDALSCPAVIQLDHIGAGEECGPILH